MSEDSNENRPRVRADCIDGPRPCPWVSCRYHLAFDVSKAGAIVPAYRVSANGRRTPMITRGEMIGRHGAERTLAWAERVLDRFAGGSLPTCALDVAEATREVTLEEVGGILGLTRERVRQIEKRAASKLREEYPDIVEDLREVVATRQQADPFADEAA